MTRSYRLPEAVSATLGACLMLLCGILTPFDALQTLGAQWNFFGFFLGLMAISALADQAGVFDALAALTARWSGGCGLRPGDRSTWRHVSQDSWVSAASVGGIAS